MKIGLCTSEQDNKRFIKICNHMLDIEELFAFDNVSDLKENKIELDRILFTTKFLKEITEETLKELNTKLKNIACILLYSETEYNGDSINKTDMCKIELYKKFFGSDNHILIAKPRPEITLTEFKNLFYKDIKDLVVED